MVRVLLPHRNRALAKRADRVTAAGRGQGLQPGLNLFFSYASCHSADLMFTFSQDYSSVHATLAAVGDWA